MFKIYASKNDNLNNILRKNRTLHELPIPSKGQNGNTHSIMYVNVFCFLDLYQS